MADAAKWGTDGRKAARLTLTPSSMLPPTGMTNEGVGRWTIAGGKDYAGKPDLVVVQDHSIDTTASVTDCAFATDPTEALESWPAPLSIMRQLCAGAAVIAPKGKLADGLLRGIR